MSYASRVRGSASPPKCSQGERFIAGLSGHLVTIELVSGLAYQGVLLQKTTPNTFCLGQVQQIRTTAERPKVFPFQDERLFDASEVARIKVRPETKADRDESAGFRIDSEISKSTDGAMRSLEKWDAGDASAGAPAGLDEVRLRPEDRGWDQFEVNQKLFGYKSSYAEENYTTNLDRKSEFYRQHERMARKVAAEIQNQTSTNPHLAEERGHQVEAAMDEESRFSTVLDDAGKPRMGYADDANLSWRNRSDDLEPPIEPENVHVSRSPSKKSSVKKSKPESGRRSMSPPKAKSPPKEPVGKEAAPNAPVDEPQEESPVQESVQATDGNPVAPTLIDTKGQRKPSVPVEKQLNHQAKPFHFNAGAKEFVPRFDAVAIPQYDPSYPVPVQIMGPMNMYGQYLPQVGPVSVGPIPYGTSMMVPIPAPGAYPIGAYGPVPMGTLPPRNNRQPPTRRNKQQHQHQQHHNQQQQQSGLIDGAEAPELALQTDGKAPPPQGNDVKPPNP